MALFQFWDDPLMILAVVGIFFAGQAVEGNFLTPKLVGGSVGLHPVALMFALSAFGSLLGFTGMLIAVPTAAAIGVVGRFAIDQYTSGRLYQGHEGQAEAQAAAARSEERAEFLAAQTFPPAAAERTEEETPG